MKTFLHIIDFKGNQIVHGPNESFSAASKSFKQHQTMNKGLIHLLQLSDGRVRIWHKQHENMSLVSMVQVGGGEMV